MDTLGDYLRHLEDTPSPENNLSGNDVEVLEVEGGGSEVTFIAQNIRDALQMAREATGLDLSSAEIRDLPGNTLGMYEPGSDRTSIDEDVLKSDYLGQVVTHEGLHGKNRKKSRGIRLASDFEEGLTEESAALKTGKKIAYPEERAKVAAIASHVGKTRRHLLELFQSGENEQLNEYYEDWRNEKAA